MHCERLNHGQWGTFTLFGPEDGNLESDIFHKGVLTDQKQAYSKAQSSRSNQMNGLCCRL